MMRWFKVRYPDKIDVADFSLFFKNLMSSDIEHLLSKLREQFGDIEIQ